MPHIERPWATCVYVCVYVYARMHTYIQTGIDFRAPITVLRLRF